MYFIFEPKFNPETKSSVKCNDIYTTAPLNMTYFLLLSHPDLYFHLSLREKKKSTTF